MRRPDTAQLDNSESADLRPLVRLALNPIGGGILVFFACLIAAIPLGVGFAVALRGSAATLVDGGCD